MWSDCGGVVGGVVVPWYPHTPLSNTSHHLPLVLTLSLLVPPPPHQTTPPHLLLWSPSKCKLEMAVTFDPLVLLDKLAVLHAPILLPWVTARCITASGPHWLLWELVILTLLQALAAW